MSWALDAPARGAMGMVDYVRIPVVVPSLPCIISGHKSEDMMRESPCSFIS